MTDEEKIAIKVQRRIIELNRKILSIGEQIRQQMEQCPHPSPIVEHSESWKYKARSEVVCLYRCLYCGQQWETLS